MFFKNETRINLFVFVQIISRIEKESIYIASNRVFNSVVFHIFPKKKNISFYTHITNSF